MSAALAVWIAAAPLAAAGNGEPSLKDIVRRMSAYVAAYGEKASIVVATEHYTQHFRPAFGAVRDRKTVADFAIVKAEGLGGWVGFRDVVEVDGAAVTDREDRLIQVLTAASGRIDEAQRLSNESARFNIGPLQRNFNVPTAVLFFFRPENLERFKFARKGVQPDGTWEIGFRETSRPTLIRTPMGVSVPSDGSIWVDVETGTVVRTRIHMTLVAAPVPAMTHTVVDGVDRFCCMSTPGDPHTASVEIDVTYRRVATLDMWLPETMTELSEGTGSMPFKLTGEATYSNYRQFQTAIRIK